jgi:hypothetical protein
VVVVVVVELSGEVVVGSTEDSSADNCFACIHYRRKTMNLVVDLAVDTCSCSRTLMDLEHRNVVAGSNDDAFPVVELSNNTST